MRKTRLFLISLCVLMLGTALFAQDETPTALPTETPTQLPTETPLPMATPLPTETATLTPTLTPTLTTAPTLTATPVEVSPTLESISATATIATIEVIPPTATSVSVEIISPTEIAEEEIEIVPVVSSTATSSPTLTAIPAISATVTATETLPQTPTVIPFVAEPALMTLVADDFELGELFLWTASKNWSFAQVEGGTVLQSKAGVDPLTFAQTNMLDVSATIQVQLNGGSMAMHLRESQAGRYSLTLNANGILALYRDTILLEGTTLAPLGTDWHSLTLSAIGDILRVKVDDVTLLAIQDPSPLSAGGLSIASVDGSPLRVDDFELAVPDIAQVASVEIISTEMPTALPTFTPPPSEAELNAMFASKESIVAQSLVFISLSVNAGDSNDLITKLQNNCTSTNNLVSLTLGGGTYTLNTPIGSPHGSSGLPLIKCNLTIIGNNAVITRNVTASEFRIMAVDTGASLTLNDVTISQGELSSGGGAGIYSYRSNLTLNNVILENNILNGNYVSGLAIRGAGIGIYQGRLNIQNSIIRNNDNLGSGSTDGVRGGGIAIDATVNGYTHIIADTTISNNTATHGGAGVYVEYAALNIQRSTINGNTTNSVTVGAGGGGLMVGLAGTATVTNSVFQNNDAFLGDAIYNLTSTTIHDSCIIDNNGVSSDVVNLVSSPLDATGNFWGSTSEPGVEQVSGNVDTAGYIDYEITVPDDCQNGFPPPITTTLDIEVKNSLNGETFVIPYEEAIFTISITNSFDFALNDVWLELSPFTDQPDPHPVPIRTGDRVPGYPLVYYNIPPKNSIEWRNLSISANSTVELKFFGSLKRSTPIEISGTLTSVEHNLNLPVNHIVDAEITKLDFDGEHAGLRSQIFWGIFNETSEFNFLTHNLSSASIPCIDDGWVTSQNPNLEIVHVVHNEGTSSAGCQNHLVVQAHTMINGMLNRERQFNANSAYRYAGDQFKGSLGNERVPGSEGYCDKVCSNRLVGNTSEVNSNTLWHIQSCWSGQSYTSVLASNNSSSILSWLEHYMNCYVLLEEEKSNNGNLRSRNRVQGYNQLFNAPNDIIDNALTTLETTCVDHGFSKYDNSNLESYFNCDVSAGGWGLQQTDAFIVSIEDCDGEDINAALTNASNNILPSFKNHMKILGSPDYGGNPQTGYRPTGASASLQPIIWIRRALQYPEYPVTQCEWLSIIYKHAKHDIGDAEFAFPR